MLTLVCVRKALFMYFSSFGVPDQFASDSKLEFMEDRVIENYLKLMQVSRRKSTTNQMA